MRALLLSGVVLVIGAVVAQQAAADERPHGGPAAVHGGSVQLVAHGYPGRGYPGHGGPRYGYPGPHHLPPPYAYHHRPPVVVYPPVYAYPTYRYYRDCYPYYGYSGGLQFYTGRVGVSIGF